MTIKLRQSNIELCRLISIILILLVHSTERSLGYQVSYGVHLLCAFSIIGVNVFVLITGYFSTTPKKLSLLNLTFICFFWWIVKMGFKIGFYIPIQKYDLFFITVSNWFIPTYICLLFLAPMLNLFSCSVSQKRFLGGVIVLLLLEVWFDWLPPTVDLAHDGYSPFSFSIIYLIGRYIRLYGLPLWFKKLAPLLYFSLSIFIGLVGYWLSIRNLGLTGKWYAYNNPFIVISSVVFFMTFVQFKLNSGIINHMAKSSLAVLLGHIAIFFLYKEQFLYIYNNLTGFRVVVCWIAVVFLVFISCIALDQLRLMLYKPIEKLIKSKIRNNNIF